jgi:hypothetical protein
VVLQMQLATQVRNQWRIDPVRVGAFIVLCLFLTAVVVVVAKEIGSGRLLGSLSRSEAASATPANAEGLAVEDLSLSPAVLRPLSPEVAIIANHNRPETSTAIPVAAPVVITQIDRLNRMKAIDCLTAAIYYEAAYEPHDGQTAVAQVVLNRMRLPQYPHSVCGVVFQGSERSTGCQFSFTCDGSMRRPPSIEGWRRASAVAQAALSGQVNSHVGWATHYHADYVAPYWAPKLIKLKTIGRHIFYGWPGIWNRPSAFTQAYAGSERGLTDTPVGEPATVPLPSAGGGRATIARVVPVDERPVLAGPPAGLADAKSDAPDRWILGTAPRIVAQEPESLPAL